MIILGFGVFGIEKQWLEPNAIEGGNVMRFFVGIGLGYCRGVVVFFLWDPKTANPFKLNENASEIPATAKKRHKKSGATWLHFLNFLKVDRY